MRLATEVPDRGYFETGDLALVEAAFTAPVFLGGGGGGVYLKLLVGESELSVDLISGSSTATPQFLYTVGAGHEDGDGVSVPAGVLTLDAGVTLKDKYGQDAVLTHGAFGPFAGSLVNTPPPPPKITGMELDSAPANGRFYTSGDDIVVDVTFERAVTLAGGTPPELGLMLQIGTTARTAGYLRGSGTRTLGFKYDVLAENEDKDTDGVTVPEGALTLGAGMTLKDRDDQDAVLTHGAFGPFARSLVNTPPPPPKITKIEIVSDQPDRGYYQTNDNIDVQVTFNEAVTVSGTGFLFLKLLVGGTEREVNLYDRGQKTLTFSYSVQANDEDTDGVSVPANALTLTGTLNLKGVNRHSILTPNRRAKLTPLSGTAEVVPVVNRGDPRGFV